MKRYTRRSFDEAVSSAPVNRQDQAATTTLSPSAPASVDHRQNGVVEATASEDEDTCSGLVFKRKRVVDVTAPTHLASDDRAPSFGENPPSVSSPRDIVVHEGGGKSASGGDHGAPPAVDFPAFLQQALQSFQDREKMESLGEAPLQEHVAKCLGDFLVASSLAMTKVQELQTEMQGLREAASQDALQIKKLKQLETALDLKVSDLRQTDKETKRLLFEKSHETLSAHSKILTLRTEVVILQEKAKES